MHLCKHGNEGIVLKHCLALEHQPVRELHHEDALCSYIPFNQPEQRILFVLTTRAVRRSRRRLLQHDLSLLLHLRYWP